MAMSRAYLNSLIRTDRERLDSEILGDQQERARLRAQAPLTFALYDELMSISKPFAEGPRRVWEQLESSLGAAAMDGHELCWDITIDLAQVLLILREG